MIAIVQSFVRTEKFLENVTFIDVLIVTKIVFMKSNAEQTGPVKNEKVKSEKYELLIMNTVRNGVGESCNLR